MDPGISLIARKDIHPGLVEDLQHILGIFETENVRIL